MLVLISPGIQKELTSVRESQCSARQMMLGERSFKKSSRSSILLRTERMFKKRILGLLFNLVLCLLPGIEGNNADWDVTGEVVEADWLEKTTEYVRAQRQVCDLVWRLV